jgi:N-succinyldiaminopimelate aminotransferase
MSQSDGATPNSYLAPRLRGFGTTVFAEMSALAQATGAINLGQGFPDEDGPPEVLEAAVEAIRTGRNQYPPGIGLPELRRAIAVHQKRFYDIDLDPETEVLVTAGATEAITAAVVALCDRGDEVILFEPFYDSYKAAVAIAGASPVPVCLDQPGWTFDPDVLAAAVTPKTRLLLLNSPHNPTGAVFPREQLEAIASVCIEHDLIAVTDEVYEHLVFEGTHTPLATLPGMAERTVSISSAGKTFSVTGWKVGWATGPAELVAAVRTVKQFLTYVNAGPFQPAVAAGLALPDSYFQGAASALRERRDILCAGLEAAGLDIHRPAATYFVVADITGLGEKDGREFCLALPARSGVVAVPASAFYDDATTPRPLVRFAFCKRLEVLDEAARRLALMRSATPPRRQ